MGSETVRDAQGFKRRTSAGYSARADCAGTCCNTPVTCCTGTPCGLTAGPYSVVVSFSVSSSETDDGGPFGGHVVAAFNGSGSATIPVTASGCCLGPVSQATGSVSGTYDFTDNATGGHSHGDYAGQLTVSVDTICNSDNATGHKPTASLIGDALIVGSQFGVLPSFLETRLFGFTLPSDNGTLTSAVVGNVGIPAPRFNGTQNYQYTYTPIYSGSCIVGATETWTGTAAGTALGSNVNRQISASITFRYVGMAPCPALAAVNPNAWPVWASMLATMATNADAGVGDTAARLIGPTLSNAVSVWFKKATGGDCGCSGRQSDWNMLYPYDWGSARLF